MRKRKATEKTEDTKKEPWVAPEQRVFKQDDGKYTINLYYGKCTVLYKDGEVDGFSLQNIDESEIERIINQFNELKNK